MMDQSPKCYIANFNEIGPPVLEKKIFKDLGHIVGTMKLVRRLVLTKNTPMILKAKLDIKLKVIMSPFISRLLLGQKSVASYWKMGR